MASFTGKKERKGERRKEEEKEIKCKREGE